MTARLLYHPSHHPHEGVNGFLLRLAEGNGCNGIRTLVGDQPVTRPRLANWLGRDDGLGQLVGQLNAKKATPRPLWNNRSSRYCTACLKADSTWRQEWELTLLTVCPFHGCRLVEVCQDCGRQITWNRMRLLSCDCGFRFQAACATKATEAETALAATLYAKLTGRGRVPTLVALLSLEQMYQLIVALGAYSHVEHGKRPQKIANLGHLQVSEKLTRAAAEMLATWPAGFNALLDKLAHDHSAPSREVGLPKQFGFFYAYVFNWMNAPEFGFVLSAFERYIAKHWPHPLNERNKRMSPELRSRSVWIPVSVAAKELGTTRKRLLLLAEAGMIRLNSRKTASGRTVLCVERNGLPAIRLVLADLMDHRSACAILNITKGRMYQLLHYNVVRAIIVPRRWGAGVWGISMKSLQTVLLAGDGLPSVEIVGRDAAITMDYALRHFLKRQCLFPLLVGAAIKKEIVPIAVLREVPGIAGWVFDRGQLNGWIEDRIQGKRKGMLTIPEAAARLRLKQQAVYHFVSKGLIRVDYDPDSSAALVPEDELMRFQKEYALGREIGEKLGTSASQAVRMLQKQEALAICGKTVDGCSQYLYRRDDRLDTALSKLEQKMGDAKLHVPKDMEAWLEMRDVGKEII